MRSQNIGHQGRFEMSKTVRYEGLKCILYETYMNDDRPLVKIISPKDIDAAYALGFECI